MIRNNRKGEFVMQHLGTKTLETTRLLLRKTKESDAHMVSV